MKDPKTFCTCKDLKCPNHPVNHDRGCGPCIAKNLALDEIPSCFFNQLDDEGIPHGYSREDYAALVLKQPR